MPDLLRQITIENQKILLYKARINDHAKKLERLQQAYIEQEKSKVLSKYYPKIKDKYYSFNPDLVNALFTLAKVEGYNHQIEIRNINYDVKFYYLTEGKMQCIQ